MTTTTGQPRKRRRVRGILLTVAAAIGLWIIIGLVLAHIPS
jgi:fatty acid desaturase